MRDSIVGVAFSIRSSGIAVDSSSEKSAIYQIGQSFFKVAACRRIQGQARFWLPPSSGTPSSRSSRAAPSRARADAAVCPQETGRRFGAGD